MTTIAATLGDPTGIGPEIASKAISNYLKKNKKSKVIIFADREIFSKKDLARLLPFERKKNLSFRSIWSTNFPSRKYKTGAPSKDSGLYALTSLQSAISHCLTEKNSALVTGPLDKYFVSLNLPGFSGHTEYLRDQCKVNSTTMMLTGPKVTVSLVTTHIPVSKISLVLNKESIVDTTLKSEAHLKLFSKRPKLAICGLNPHASDHGLFGHEEAEIITPAINILKQNGLKVEGPVPADSLFHRSQEFDAIICMYHDQGLIPLKMKHFYDAVNLTLGLPFPRVSVDHGTAFDIAGKNKASHVSYLKALDYATKWSKGIYLSKRRD